MPFVPKPVDQLKPESLHLKIRRAALKNGYYASRHRNFDGWRIADLSSGTILAGHCFDLSDAAALAYIEDVPEGASISVSLTGL